MPKVRKKQMVSEDVWSLALDRVRQTFDMVDEVVVSFSGGKDSTCVLHLVETVAKERGRLPVRVMFWDEEAIPWDTINYVEEIAQNPNFNVQWLCLPIKHRNACSKKHPYWNPWAPEDEAKWCRPMPKRAIKTLPGFKRGMDIPTANHLVATVPGKTVAVFLGIRAAESLRRYRSVASRRYLNFISQEPGNPTVWFSKPIYDFTVNDVWTAPKVFGWRYNPAYDVMTKAGISRHDQRVCPPYGEEPLRGLWQYAVCWPDMWEKMVNRVPGAATAGRYSRSPLYGFGDVAGWDPKHPNKRELIDWAIERWDQKTAWGIKRRIEEEISYHFQRTKDPIPDQEPGESGVSWKYLFMLASRGDLKGRRTRVYEDYQKGYKAPSKRKESEAGSVPKAAAA